MKKLVSYVRAVPVLVGAAVLVASAQGCSSAPAEASAVSSEALAAPKECSSDAIGLQCTKSAGAVILALRSALYAVSGSEIAQLIGEGTGIPAAVTLQCAPDYTMSCVIRVLGIEGTCAVFQAASKAGGPQSFAAVVTACTAFKIGYAAGECVGDILACWLYPPDALNQPIDPTLCPYRPSVLACVNQNGTLVPRDQGTVFSDCVRVVNGYKDVTDPNIVADCKYACVKNTNDAIRANCLPQPPAGQPGQPGQPPAGQPGQPPAGGVADAGGPDATPVPVPVPVPIPADAGAAP